MGEIGFLRGIWLDASRRLTWLEDYAAAIDEDAQLPAPDRIERSVRFDHVSFKYPGTDRLVLDDVSIELPAGVVVAIVGENGAGKTTLVKLLCRMYAPTSGAIFVDDVDLAEISSQQWRERVAGAFQDFFRFEFQAHDDGRARRRAADGRAAGGVRCGRPGRCRRRDRPARSRARHAARTDMGRGRRGLVRAVAEAGARPGVHARPTRSFWCSTSRHRRSMPRPSMRCSSATPRRRAEIPATTATATAGSRSSSRTASRRCGWPT